MPTVDPTKPASSQLSHLELIAYLLGITADDIIEIKTTRDQRRISTILTRALVYLAGITKIESSDSDAVKANKKENYSKGLDLYQEILALLDGAVSDVLREKDKEITRLTDRLRDTTDAIKYTDVMRIGRWGFGPDDMRPDDIRVSEAYGTQTASTIRSEVDVSFRTPRSMTKITVNMTFAGNNKINNILRPMIADLLVAPITTLESPFLSNILVNSYASPELEAEVKARVLQGDTQINDILQQLTDDARSDWDRLKEILKSDDFVLEFIQSKINDERRKIESSNTIDLDNRKMSLDDAIQLGVQIPAVVTNIVVYTDPRAVNTLHVQMVFIRYHSAAFGITGLQFMDKDGNPTPDISKCPWIQLLAQQIYLNPNKEKYFMEVFSPPENADFSCTWKDLYNRSGQDLDTVGYSADGIPGFRTFPGKSSREVFVTESVQVVIDFGVSLLPILGSKYPAVQIMGSPTFHAKIGLATTSEKVVREFHVMKDHLDAIARNMGAMGRDEEVFISNSVLNSLSAKRFIISAVETYPYPQTTNAYKIEIDLTHSRYSRRDKLRNLFLEESGAIPKSLMRSFLQYLYNKFQEYVQDPTKNYGYEVKAAVLLLFGSPDNIDENEGNGIVNASTVAAAAIRGALGGALGWELQKSISELYSKMSKDGDGDWKGPDAKLFEVATKLKDAKVNEREFGLDNEPNPTIEFGPIIREARVDRSIDEIIRQGYEASGNTAFGDGNSVAAGIIDFQARGILSLPRPLFEQIIEVLLEQPKSPNATEETKEKIWKDEQVVLAYQTVTSVFASGRISMFAGFPGLKEYMEKEDEAPTIARQEYSNYPDLMMPTYQEIFSEVIDAEYFGIIGARAYKIDNGSGPNGELWHRFAPTYQDLGKNMPNPEVYLRDPTGNSLPLDQRVARTIKDHLEPAFFYYHDRIKPKLFSGYNTVLGEETFSPERNADIYKAGASGIKVLHLNRDTEDLSNSELDNDKTLSQLLEEKVEDDDDEKSLAKLALEEKIKETVHVVDNAGRLRYVLEPVDAIKGGKYKARLIKSGRPIYYNEELGLKTEKYDAERARAMMVDSLNKTQDTMYWPIRHYPAFRLYFVEFDDNEHRDKVVRGVNAMGARLIDDLYSTNAVISFNVTMTKEDAPVATITLLNTSGQFDQDEFMTRAEQETRASSQTQYGNDDEGEDYLKRIRLQTGTGIVLKMGYSSDPADLDTVFTGQIVEVEHGDVVTIVCQGYKAELFQEINYYNPTSNGRVVLREVLNKMTLPHLGRLYDIRDVAPEEFDAIVGDAVKQDSTGFFDRYGWVARKFGGRFSTVDRNIWWENYDDLHGFVANAALGIAEWAGIRADREWLFHGITGWDAVQEICRHHPGLVADVRPYGNEATLFVGYPDQIYHYREAKLSELQAYDRYINEVLPIDISTIALSVISRFWKSKYGYPRQLGGAEGKAISYWMDGEHDLAYSRRRLRMELDSAPSVETIIPDLETADYIDSGKDSINQLYWYMGHYDWTSDWEYLNRYYPELFRVLFSYFFRFKQESLFGDPNKNRAGGILDGVWRQQSKDWMSPLVGLHENKDMLFGWGSESDLQERLTPAGKAIYQLTQGDNAILGQDVSLVRQNLDELITPEKLKNTDPAEVERLKKSLQELQDLQVRRGSEGDTLVNSGHNYESIGANIWSGIWKFRALVHYFTLFLKGDNLSTEDHRKIFDAGSRLSRFRVPPGFRAFRTHHMVWDRTDIIANNIVASMREMANTVAVYAPAADLHRVSAPAAEGAEGAEMLSSNQQWVYFPSSKGAPFLPNIDVTQRKLYVARESNANLRSAQANCLISNLAIAMRPMYRGDLKIVGRHVLPWDIVNIYDNYNCIYGPVEVDRVTHEFSRETGWITTIEPHLYAIANDASDFFQTSAWHDILSVASFALDVITVVGVAIAVATGVGSGAGVALLAARKALSKGALAVASRQGAKQAARVGLRQVAKAVGSVAVGGAKLAGNAVKGSVKAVFSSGSWLWGRTTLAAKMLAGVSVFNDVAAPSLLNALNNISIMAELNGRRLPIYLKPLVHKGVPMLAGLKLRDKNIMGFGDLLGGGMRDVYRSIDKAFSSAPDGGIVSVPTR